MKRIPIFWLVVLISLTTLAFLAAGCAKKVVSIEEVAGKPPVVAQKEAPPPPKPMEAPKAEAVQPKPAPPEAPKAEAKAAPKEEAPPVKPAPLDLDALRIQFAFDDYTLSTRAEENLEKIAAWMKKKPQTKIQVQGYTCDIGTAEYNLALGDRRASSAKNYLETMGVETSRLSTISYGEERPRVPDTDEPNRSLNRRDEFAMVQ